VASLLSSVRKKIDASTDRVISLERIIESKREMRRKLAGLPVAEKLAMLDTLRDRAHMIRKAAARRETSLLRMCTENGMRGRK
jgi:hypothetical protein